MEVYRDSHRMSMGRVESVRTVCESRALPRSKGSSSDRATQTQVMTGEDPACCLPCTRIRPPASSAHGNPKTSLSVWEKSPPRIKPAVFRESIRMFLALTPWMARMESAWVPSRVGFELSPMFLPTHFGPAPGKGLYRDHAIATAGALVAGAFFEFPGVPMHLARQQERKSFDARG